MPCMSRDDKRALAVMEESLKKVNGHYQVALPWKNGSLNVPLNRELAERRLRGLQTKLLTSPALCKQYCKKMSDYVENGYVSIVPADAPAVRGKTFYVPHFCTSVLTKFRVVFDSSAKSDDVSLNDELLQGPDLVTGLLGVLIRFRQELRAVSAQPCSHQMLTGARLMVIYKKRFRRCATSRGRMAFKIKYPKCRHNFGRTRYVARF